MGNSSTSVIYTLTSFFENVYGLNRTEYSVTSHQSPVTSYQLSVTSRQLGFFYSLTPNC
ncbi:MAG: hypothetical protein AB4290_16275 [Spirulina sp.]